MSLIEHIMSDEIQELREELMALRAIMSKLLDVQVFDGGLACVRFNGRVNLTKEEFDLLLKAVVASNPDAPIDTPSPGRLP